MTPKLKKQGIYILTNRLNGKQYVGKDKNLPSRINQHLSGKAPECPAIHRAIKKHSHEAFDVEIIEYAGASHEALNAIEIWHIARLGSYKNGYNLTKGGEGLDSETSREIQNKRIENSTHNFQDPEVQKKAYTARQKNNHQRLLDGTHHMLDPQWQRKHNSNPQRLADGTHNFQGTNKYARYGNWAYRQKAKARRRKLYRLFASLLFTKSLCEICRTRQLTREGFFDKEIPDTSQAEQQPLF